MKEKKMYREENQHGSPLFPIEYYNCVYPARLPGLPVHWHEEFEITCVRRGQGTYLIDLEPCPVKEGDVLFLTSGILHGIPAGSTDFLETDSFVFHPSLLGGPLDLCSVKYLAPLEQGEVRFPAVISGEREPRLAAELAGMFARLKKEFDSEEEGHELAVKGELLKALAALYREAPFERKEKQNQEVLEKLKTVTGYIKENYQRPVSVAELADLCHFSEYYFMRFFKQYMNMTCVEYINQCRMEEAAARLASGRESVTEVALDTGFGNLSYFNRVFKKRFGMTPGAYRKDGRYEGEK